MIHIGKPVVAIVGAALCLAACSGNSGKSAGPPRADDTLPVPTQSSLFSVPVELDAGILKRAIEDEIPKTLWTIDRHFDRCIAKKKVKLFGSRVNVVPKIGCTVVGTVTRGPLRMRGDGKDIVFDMPINATVSARDVGGVLKEETATGSALVQARIRLDVGPDWTPRGKVRLTYGWTRPPGIDFLGQRVTFADEADKNLKPLMRELEASLPGYLSTIHLRPEVESLWQAGFTSISLNGNDPEVWMRLTPKRPIFGGYSLKGNRIRLNLGLEATTETFVGARPPDPRPTPLPPPAKSSGDGRLHFFVPVIADYGQIEPVIQRALDRRASRPFAVPTIGDVTATFADVTAYGTGHGRIAIGFDATARAVSLSLGEVQGRIWIEATPVNEPGSAEVSFRNLVVTGNIERRGGDLLIRLANSPGVTEAIADAVGQNFTGDRDKLVAKIRASIAERRIGDFVIRSTIADVETGELRAFGKGLYLPVKATGDATIRFEPGK